jgi:hypothetical protein
LTLLSPERGEPENALTALIADEAEALMCCYPVADALAIRSHADFRRTAAQRAPTSTRAHRLREKLCRRRDEESRRSNDRENITRG